jgi:ferritin-like metal-binding protein YciE
MANAITYDSVTRSRAVIDSLKGLFIEQIKDLYHAEKQLLEALPRMSAAASAVPLKDVLERHNGETRDQVTRLEQVLELLGERPEPRKCRAMVGLVAEMDEMLADCKSAEVRDAAIIASAQRIQHYEMAGYGTARTHAETLGENEAAQILQRTLEEEGQTDHILTDLAKGGVNRQAVTA